MHKWISAIWGSGAPCATLLGAGVTQPSPGRYDGELASVFGKEVEDPTKSSPKYFSQLLLPFKRDSVTTIEKCRFKLSTSAVS